MNEGIDGRRSQLAQIELDDELNGSRCVQDEEAAERRRDHGADGQSRTSRWSQRAMPSITDSEKVESCKPDRAQPIRTRDEVCKLAAEELRS